MPSALAFIMAEGALLSLPVFDPTQTILGVDPLVMIGLTTIGGTLTSYLVGGALTGVLWRGLKPGTARTDGRQAEGLLWEDREAPGQRGTRPNQGQLFIRLLRGKDQFGRGLQTMVEEAEAVVEG